MSGPLTDEAPIVDEAVSIKLVRIEAKLNLALAQLAPTLDSHGKEIADHEARLRVLEGRATVSPLGLWSTVVGVVAVAGGLLAIAERFVTIN